MEELLYWINEDKFTRLMTNGDLKDFTKNYLNIKKLGDLEKKKWWILTYGLQILCFALFITVS